MKKIILFIFCFAFMTPVFSEQEPLAEQIKSALQHEAVTINALLQTGLRYSLQDDEFQGGRTFEAGNARLSFRGVLDGKFHYRLFFNVTKAPNLLDAYIAYQISQALRITTGAMKPKQSLDYIPNPGSTDFIDRTIITGLLVQSREIGVSFTGDIGGFHYYSGLYNGTKLDPNNNNRFYGILRLQYTLKHSDRGSIQLAIQGSHGNTPDIRCGSSGPMLRGERTIYGGDIRFESERLLFAAEYLGSRLETVDITDKYEVISGYYITQGLKLGPATTVLGRWQSWSYQEQDIAGEQLTIGLNHAFTSITSCQINFDTYIPESGENQSGLSFLLQVQF